MEVEREQGFLGPMTSLCSHLTSSQSASGTPAVTTPQLKRIRAKALKSILFPDVQENDPDAASELCRLHAAWFVLAAAGQQDRAARLHSLLGRLGADPPPAVRSVLRLLLALADRRLGQTPPKPPLGRFGTRVCEQASWQRGPPVYSTDYMVPEVSRHFMEFPARVFSADPHLSTEGAPPPGLFDLPPGQGIGLFGEQELSEPGGPLGALVQSRSTAAPGERLRLPPLPSDPRRVPFAPETLYRPTPPQTQPQPLVRDRGRVQHRSRTPELSQEPSPVRRSPSPAGSEDPASWEAAARGPPTRGRLCWEQRGRRQYCRQPPPLSQSGPAAVPPLRRLLLSWGGSTATPPRPLPLPTLLAQLRLMMMGLDTDSFPYDSTEGAFRSAEGLCTERCSPESVAARCGVWVSCGSRCRRVAALAAAGGGGCLTGRAFATALEPCVRGYRAALAEVRVESLAEFGRRVKPLVRLMALLADVCGVTSCDSELPQKMALVSHLYERLVGASERTEWALLAHLFKSTVAPYLGFLTGWLLEGVCRDPCDEFPVRQLAGAARTNDEDFWTAAYEQVPAGTDNDHPSFLQSLSVGLYQCGRALSLLRLCDASHPLTQPSAELRVKLAFSLTELEGIQHQVISYEAAMQCHVTNTLSRHLSKQRRQELELERSAGQLRQSALSSIQETMLAQRRRRAEQKRQVLEEQLRDVERSRQLRRQRRLQDWLDTEKAEGERREDEITALRRDNQTRLARLQHLAPPDQLAAMRQQLRLDGAGADRTSASAGAGGAAGAAGAAGEPMATSADPSPDTETAPAVSPAEETVASLVSATPSPDADSGEAADSVNRNAAEDTANDVTEELHEDTKEERRTDEAGNVTAERISDRTGEKTDNATRDGEKRGNTTEADSEGNTVTNTGGSTGDTITNTEDASNANLPSPDENANALSTPASASSAGLAPASDVTAPASDVTLAASDVTTAASELVADSSSPSRAALAERRRVIRRRALGEDIGADGTESVLMDQIGGEVLRRRGRNIHGHATDSVIERLLYRGEGWGGAAGAGAAPSTPGRRRRFAPRSDDTVVRFQPPDFSVAMLPPSSAAAVAAHQLGGLTGGLTGGQLGGLTEPEEPEERTELSSCSQFSLAGSLQHSVALLLSAQLSLVNATLLNHMLVDAGLMDHLVTLRRFLLLADGEFGARLCSQLFHLVNTARSPHQLLSPATLNSVLSEALSASVGGDHPLTDRLSFVAKTVPDVLDRASPSVLTCLDLEYRAGWPHCLVLTDKCLARYKVIFHLFLQLRRALWALEQVFSLLKAAGEVSAARAGGGPQLQRLQLCRHEMQHFVLALQGYLSGQVLQVSWAELRRELQNAVHTFDELRSAHTSYIGQAAKRCLLNAKAEPIMKIVQDVLRIVLKFHAQLSSVQWTVDAEGQVVHPGFQAVMKTHRQFSGYSRFLFKVVNKTKDRFYQPHLNDLANRLNFNNFYTSDIVPVELTGSS